MGLRPTVNCLGAIGISWPMAEPPMATRCDLPPGADAPWSDFGVAYGTSYAARQKGHSVRPGTLALLHAGQRLFLEKKGAMLPLPMAIAGEFWANKSAYHCNGIQSQQ